MTNRGLCLVLLLPAFPILLVRPEVMVQPGAGSLLPATLMLRAAGSRQRSGQQPANPLCFEKLPACAGRDTGSLEVVNLTGVLLTYSWTPLSDIVSRRRYRFTIGDLSAEPVLYSSDNG